MWMRQEWRIACCLVILTTGTAGVRGSDGPGSSEATNLVIKDCTVRFVNKSTYATARPGIIAELPFEEGDYVRPGDLVVQLRDEVAQANLKLQEKRSQIESPIHVAEKELESATMAYEGAVNANRSVPNSFNKTEFEQLKLVKEARELQIEQAIDELQLNVLAKEQAVAELETYSVKAKFGGLVTRVYKHVGEAVNLGDEIITIVDTSRVRVEGTLPYAQARRLQVGDPVRVHLSFPKDRGREFRRLTSETGTIEPSARTPLPEENEKFAGRIGFIGVETGTSLGFKNEIRVWAEVVNRDNILLEGLPAEMVVLLLAR